MVRFNITDTVTVVMKRGLSLGDIPSSLVRNDKDAGPFTQVEDRGRGKRCKKSRFNAGTSSQTANVEINNTDTMSAASVVNQTSSSLSNPSSGEVMQLKAEIVSLKQTVNQLSNKLESVLSYLGLVSRSAVDADVGAGPGGSGLVDLTDFPPLPGSGSSMVPVSFASVASTSTSASADQQPTASSSNVRPGVKSFREAAVAAVYADRAESDRRAASFIIHGMPTSNSSSDKDLTARLCIGEFGLLPDIAFTKRLGRQLPGKVQPLLVYLKERTQAKNIVVSARQLRQSLDLFTRDNIYINENLTVAAARAAYDQRCRRRQIANQRSSTRLQGQGQGQGQGQDQQTLQTTSSSQTMSLPTGDQHNVLSVLDAAAPSFLPTKDSST